MTRADDIAEQNLAENLVSASEARRQSYIRTLIGLTDFDISLHIDEAIANPQAANLALVTILRRKGRVLDAAVDTSQQLQQQLSPADQRLLDELNTVHAELANLRFNRAEPSPDTITQLEARAETLADTLARNSAAFRIEFEPVSVAAVQAAIPADAALVELIRYEPFNPEETQNNIADRWGAARYAAYILTRDGTVQAVDLGDAAAIDQQVAAFRQVLSTPNAAVTEIARQLDEQLIGSNSSAPRRQSAPADFA